jgi:GT2 family glycosyltransferase
MTAAGLAASVVVATYNRAERLPGLVADLLAQQPPAEVVIVDDSSTDDTWAVLGQLCAADPDGRLQRLRTARNSGPATARNLGWRAAAGPLVAFTDDDCRPEPGWVASLVAAAAAADLVQGRTVPDPDEVHLLGPFSRTLSVTSEDGYYQTCNVAYRRDWLDRLGGFDEAFRHPAGEDTDLAWRARDLGARTAYTDAAVIRHTVRPSSVRASVRDSWRWQSVPLAVRRHPELRAMLAGRWSWRASHPRALAAVAGLSLVAAAPRRPATWLAAAAGCAPYVHYRVITAPLPTAGPRRRWLLLPGALLVDTVEVGACLVGSARYRTLVL